MFRKISTIQIYKYDLKSLEITFSLSWFITWFVYADAYKIRQCDVDGKIISYYEL